MILIVFFISVIFVCGEITKPIVVTALTESFSEASQTLHDTILLNLVFQKNSQRYFVNVIPSGSMAWDDEKKEVICVLGEDQCYRNLLQYCAIREYTYEVAHEFVRCVQFRKGEQEELYKFCKRFGELEYKEIDKCMSNREKITKELLSIQESHINPKDTSFPQLSVDNRQIPLTKLQIDPQYIFDRVQYRICSIAGSLTDIPQLCRDNYRVEVESINIQINEQEIRNHRSTQRIIKFSDDIYTNLTLHSFSHSIQHQKIEVSVIFDINADFSVLSSRVYELINSRQYSMSLLSLYLIIPSLPDRCVDLLCLKAKAFLCSSFVSTYKTIIVRFQLCILTINSTIDDFPAGMMKCAEELNVFLPIATSCIDTNDLTTLISNMTSSAFLVAQKVEDESLMTVLAGDDDDNDDNEFIVEEGDDEFIVVIDERGNALSASDLSLLQHLLPLSILVNHRSSSQSLPIAVCDAYDQSKPMECSGIQPVTYIHAISGIPEIASLSLYIDMNCDKNLQNLRALFDWLSQNEEIEKRVKVSVHTTVDVLFDMTEDGYVEMRTPRNHHHVVVAVAAQCAVQLGVYSKYYWPFIECLLSHNPQSSSFTQQCADQTGYDVRILQGCLDNPRTLEHLWKEKVSERKRDFWVSVSPYVILNDDHIRVEDVPFKICQLMKTQVNECDNMKMIHEGRGVCGIKVIH